ncbi:MAG: VIT1/CCC1 transporter family protein [Sulfolobaceae archaeon]
MDKELTHYTREADVFRTKVFGIQDGTIGTGAIVLGAVGYTNDPIFILIAGLLAVIGQAFSMGVGEYISTKVRLRVLQNEIKKEEIEIEKFPEKEKEEIIGFYIQKGLSRLEAEKIAEVLMRDKKIILYEMMIHELKMIPEEFESPLKLAVIMSFYLIIGGIIPLIPFIVNLFYKFSLTYAITISIILILSLLGFFGILSSKYTGISKTRSALEQIGIGVLALIGSFLAGHLLSVFLHTSFLLGMP